MISEPIHVTDAEFEEKVLQAELPVIVDFWAPWCSPCKMVAPILDKLASEYKGQIIFAKVNTDEDTEWAMKFDVMGIPTMLSFNEGALVHQQVGALPETHIRDMVESLLEAKSQVVTH
jgi:thioredoxin 1